MLPICSLSAQNYNISVLPARVIYSKQTYTESKKFELYLLYKFVEIEKRFNNHFSFNLGVAYNRNKEKSFQSSYKELYYKFDPSVRYYINSNSNMSGLYMGSGINYSKFSFETSGRVASTDNTVKENNVYRYFLDYDLHVGYKICLIKNRFSVDFKLNELVSIYNIQHRTQIFIDDSQQETYNSFSNGKIDFPYLDLKLGYRFGFKK